MTVGKNCLVIRLHETLLIADFFMSTAIVRNENGETKMISICIGGLYYVNEFVKEKINLVKTATNL